MARQERSEVTRRKILNAAIDVFDEVGYAAAGRSEIVERAALTKGALYHHFDSMDALASAIIGEGSDIVLGAFDNLCQAPSPALENMIHGTFVTAGLVASDRVARAAEQLALALGEFNETAANVYARWLEAMAVQVKRAVAEGDLREDLDPDVVSDSIVGAMFGAQLLSRVTSGGDLAERLSRLWEYLLPTIAADAALPYFREFLARESLRRPQTPPAD